LHKKKRPTFTPFYIKYANLRPEARVLEIGCGAGKIASSLTGYLSAEGEYWGFDNRKEVIEWCQAHISTEHGNFHFLHGDVYNRQYNPKGKLRAEEYQLPFENASFDLVFIISVFPHMALTEIENYLGEAARLLKEGGVFLSTYFLFNQQVRKGFHVGPPRSNFVPQGEHTMVARGHSSGTIAIEEGYLAVVYAEKGLEITQTLPSGTWATGMGYLRAQSIVIATRKPGMQ
jgi:SAM-dependent methyltransferase